MLHATLPPSSYTAFVATPNLSRHYLATMSGVEAVKGVASIQVYSQTKQLYSSENTDLSNINLCFTQLDQTACSFKLGPLRQLVVFGPKTKVAQAHDKVVVCTEAPQLDKALLAQTIYSSCANHE